MQEYRILIDAFLKERSYIPPVSINHKSLLPAKKKTCPYKKDASLSAAHINKLV